MCTHNMHFYHVLRKKEWLRCILSECAFRAYTDREDPCQLVYLHSLVMTIFLLNLWISGCAALLAT